MVVGSSNCAHINVLFGFLPGCNPQGGSRNTESTEGESEQLYEGYHSWGWRLQGKRHIVLFMFCYICNSERLLCQGVVYFE